MRHTSRIALALLGLAVVLPAQDEQAAAAPPQGPVIPAMTDATLDEAIEAIETVLQSDAFAENPARALSRPLYDFSGKILRGGKLSEEQEARLVAFLEKVREQAPSQTSAIDTHLFQVRNLTIGKTAPDIVGEDLDGVQFRLSDYRGKVVVLDFWGDW
ncbi:MAG: redoxin domain-containing protein [Planctomycetes bacterium]|nr:redoxin domain-containing protein [Planctomycetota bacterium]